jgi:TRAP-type C4-dicarboxylate transport system permease small subunit
LAVFKKIKLWGDRIILITASLLMLGIVLLLLTQIISRVFFNSSFYWAVEIMRLFQIWVTFIAVPLVLKRREHPGFRAIPNMLPFPARRILLLLSLFLIAVLGAAMTYYGIGLIAHSYAFKSAAGISRAIFILPVVIGGIWTVVEALWQGLELARLKKEVESC